MTKLKQSPLYDEHLNLNALMGPFAGWNMPIHYGSILEETKHAGRGWDAVIGIPTRPKLEALELGDVADGLEKLHEA